MIVNSKTAFGGLLAMGAAPGGDQPGGMFQSVWGAFPFLLLIFAFYFAILRPQQRRQKQLDQMVKSLRAGDRVTTTSGIIGTVVTVKDKSVSIRSADTKLEVLKTAISEITAREGEPAASPSQS
ncbi:MAG TPA: preprotein translocase subunit YajC [Verrucomicrobiae bacterium]|jgi:preprotein translocase subunit YajC|nr:preprotein translocase subunit YajC [Verrucomicrobiae bacterium]